MADWEYGTCPHIPTSFVSCFDTNIRSNNSIIKENATCTAQWTRET